MEEQSFDKQEAIFKSTLELITEKGFDGTPISMIAKNAGVAAGTIYVYFSSKEELITKLYLKTKTELTEYITSSVNVKESSRQTLDCIIEKYISFMVQNPCKFKYIEQFYNSPYFDKLVQSECLRIFDSMIKFIQNAIDEKLIKDIEMPIIHAFVFSPLNHIISLHFRNVVRIDEDVVKILTQNIWDSIKL